MIKLYKKPLIILLFLVAIRIAMSIALIYGFPEKGNYAGGYFYLSDEEEYFKLAFSLARFTPIDSYRTLGFPLLLLPFIWISKASSLNQLLLPVAIFHSCVLSPIAVILIALIAKWLTKEWKVALLSATIWTLFPYLVYVFIHTNPSYCEDVPAMRMAHQMWLQSVSDPPSAFLVLLAIWTFLVSLEKKSIIYPILIGVSFGLATLVRIGNGGLAILFLLFYLHKRKLKSLFLFISSSFFIAIPQFIYNWHFYGSPIKFTTFFAIEKSYADEFSKLINQPPLEAFSLGNFFFSLQQIILKFPFVILLFVFIIFLVIIYTLFKLYREYRRAAVTLILWILPYFFIYSIYSHFYKSIFRFLMPIIPALIIIISIALRRSLWFR